MNMQLAGLFLFFYFGVMLPLSTHAIPYSPWLSQQRHGPLYEGVKLLITDVEFEAELAWNETEFQLKEAVDALFEQQAAIDKKQVGTEERLILRINSAYEQCYPRHVRTIESLTDELELKRQLCWQIMTRNLATLQNDSNSELNFLSNATAEVRNVLNVCNVIALKGDLNSNDHAGITLCVIGRIGALEQRLMAATKNFSDLLATIVPTEGNAVDSSCMEFEELRQHFDRVHEEIGECVEQSYL